MFNLVNIALVGFFIWSGNAVATSTPAVPVQAAQPEFSVRMTGYNAVPEQTDSTPDITASGVRSNPEIIAARSSDLAADMPFGTVIELSHDEASSTCGYAAVEHQIGYRVIADVMHERKKRQVDILFDMDKTVRVGGKAINPAVAAGICNVTARVVGKIDLKNIPTTQAELALLVNGNLALK